MSQFLTHPNREFFVALQGIKSSDQGNFRPDQGIPLSSTGSSPSSVQVKGAPGMGKSLAGLDPLPGEPASRDREETKYRG